MFRCDPLLNNIKDMFLLSIAEAKEVVELRYCLLNERGYIFARSHSLLSRSTWDKIGESCNWKVEEMSTSNWGATPFYYHFVKRNNSVREALMTNVVEQSSMPGARSSKKSCVAGGISGKKSK
jgi:hypothetical protein